MKHIVILGAGTAGTMMSNHLKKELDDNHEITIIDQNKEHHYQPGYLFIPFGVYEAEDIVKPLARFIPKGVQYVQDTIDKVVPEANQVWLSSGRKVLYDLLIVATGTRIAPEEVDGMQGAKWQKNIFDFYTLQGAQALQRRLSTWQGGHLVVHISEMPIKCPVAPLEFAFLADAFFTDRKMRDKVRISYVTPMDGAFTKPVATAALQHLLEEKGIEVVPNFNVLEIDQDQNLMRNYAGKEVSYDLLVTVPTNKGADYVERSGMGDELNFIPTHKGSLQSEIQENIFAIGDATNLPTSKAGSVAHFEGEVLLHNVLRFLRQEPLREDFDGHANCFIETGHQKALLIDFNYEHEPVPGTFPIAGLGPLKLLKETHINHLGKMAFKWVYWNMLIKGRHLPLVSSKMQEAGKEFAEAEMAYA